MELLEGGDLATFMNHLHLNLFSEKALLRLLADCVIGIAYLHQNLGVAHFDIKPENILLDGTKKRAKIADFGMAVNPTRVNVSTPRGTFQYMPPELYSAIRADWRVDVWSLGLTFYELATGTHPFYFDLTGLTQEEIKVQMRGKILSTTIPPLTGRYFQPSPDLIQLIGKMLDTRQAQRPLIAEVINSNILLRVVLTGILIVSLGGAAPPPQLHYSFCFFMFLHLETVFFSSEIILCIT